MRTANFSSSGIHRLMGFGRDKVSPSKAFYEYVQVKKWEQRLGRSIDTASGGRETSWGNLVELRAFDLLPLNYVIQSDFRYQHPELAWSGAPDMLKDGDTVCDIKCPFTLKSFCEQLEYFGDAEKFKDEKPEYYWQLVSNSLLTDRPFAEIILYVPYREELKHIREMVDNYLGDQNKVAWVQFANDNDLPFLIKGNEYQNLNVFKFEVPQRDKEFLIERVTLATELLNN